MLDWLGAPAETTEAYEQLLTRLWKRALEQVELIISDGCEAIGSGSPTPANAICGFARRLRGS